MVFLVPTIRALLVEDVDLAARALVRMLAKRDIVTDVARDAPEARALLQANRYAVVIADFRLNALGAALTVKAAMPALISAREVPSSVVLLSSVAVSSPTACALLSADIWPPMRISGPLAQPWVN